jgi:N,N'-diacetyllegionaminate synthase
MNSTFIIAEMACSHDGSIELAKKIIDGAINANADAIQFQIWKHQDIVVPDHPDIDLLLKVELSYENWNTLADYVRYKDPNMEIIACVYDSDSAEFANNICVDAYKIHTADLSNPFFIKEVAAYGKRIDLSVGASTYSEITDAISWINDTSDSEIWLMYGKQLFPTMPSDAEIMQAVSIANVFELSLGYQDHSDADSKEAFFLPIAARGAGICIQEKHITHDRSLKGADHQAALNPDEFEEFVKAIRTIDLALGDGKPHPFSDAEKKYRIYSKKSLVAKKSLSKGAIIKRSDIVALRTKDLGLPPDCIDLIIGKTLLNSIEAFSLVKHEDVL